MEACRCCSVAREGESVPRIVRCVVDDFGAGEAGGEDEKNAERKRRHDRQYRFAELDRGSFGQGLARAHSLLACKMRCRPARGHAARSRLYRTAAKSL